MGVDIPADRNQPIGHAVDLARQRPPSSFLVRRHHLHSGQSSTTARLWPTVSRVLTRRLLGASVGYRAPGSAGGMGWNTLFRSTPSDERPGFKRDARAPQLRGLDSQNWLLDGEQDPAGRTAQDQLADRTAPPQTDHDQIRIDLDTDRLQALGHIVTIPDLP